MPELPDIRLYIHALESRLLGARLAALRIQSPFLLRTVSPSPAELEGRTVREVHRIGKRIVIGLEGEQYLVIHLMIAGRLGWSDSPGKAPGKRALLVAEFSAGTLWLTEASTKRRASLHLITGTAGLAGFDRGGLDVSQATAEQFAAALRRENHTLKRALTDPRILDGIGNAYSDEILHRAHLSPLQLTSRLDPEMLDRLHSACKEVLEEWTRRLAAETGDGFPVKVTAFRPEMAVHGKFRQPCPVCGTPVQRIRYAENETNYCPTCQTGGRLLADRGLSRLLKEDWPRSIAELEDRLGR
jgi:formamidopyrimidine-DNA glycosylase